MQVFGRNSCVFFQKSMIIAPIPLKNRVKPLNSHQSINQVGGINEQQRGSRQTRDILLSSLDKEYHHQAAEHDHGSIEPKSIIAREWRYDGTRSEDEEDIKDIAANHVAEREVRIVLDGCDTAGGKFRQGGSERNDGQTDDGITDTERRSDGGSGLDNQFTTDYQSEKPDENEQNSTEYGVLARVRQLLLSNGVFGLSKVKTMPEEEDKDEQQHHSGQAVQTAEGEDKNTDKYAS